jgi:hypothetical protein
MSGFDLTNLREISNEPQSKFVNQIAKKLAKFLNANQTDKLESKEDLYSISQDVDSILKIHSLGSTKYFDFINPYYPPLEPDGVFLRAWVRGYNTGNIEKEWSTFDRTVDLLGDPILVDGDPFDLGIHSGGTKSTALRFNRPTSDLENNEGMIIENLGSETMDIDNLTTPGKSYFMRFRVFNIAQEGGASRRLWEKTDNATPDDGIQVKIASDGRLIVIIKKSGIEYKKETAAGTIALNTVYDLWVTFADSSGTIHIYVNNVDKTLSTNVDATNWHGDLTNVDTYVFRRGYQGSGGHVYGDLYDFRIYDAKVVTAAEVGYMYTNKWTIANIPFGQVCITNYCATYVETPGDPGGPPPPPGTTHGYDSTGYDSTGYDT